MLTSDQADSLRFAISFLNLNWYYGDADVLETLLNPPSTNTMTLPGPDGEPNVEVPQSWYQDANQDFFS